MCNSRPTECTHFDMFADRNSLILRLSFIAATHATHIQVWKTPSSLVREFAPFVLHRVYTGHYDDALSITWAPDSQCVFQSASDSGS